MSKEIEDFLVDNNYATKENIKDPNSQLAVNCIAHYAQRLNQPQQKAGMYDRFKAKVDSMPEEEIQKLWEKVEKESEGVEDTSGSQPNSTLKESNLRTAMSEMVKYILPDECRNDEGVVEGYTDTFCLIAEEYKNQPQQTVSDEDVKEFLKHEFEVINNPNEYNYEDVEYARKIINATDRAVKWMRDKLTQTNESSSLNLAELERKLDEALDSETSESLKKWLNEKRSQTNESECQIRKGKECVKPSECEAYGCHKPHGDIDDKYNENPTNDSELSKALEWYNKNDSELLNWLWKNEYLNAEVVGRLFENDKDELLNAFKTHQQNKG